MPKTVNNLLKLITEDQFANDSPLDVEEFILKNFKSNSVALLNINSLLYHIYDFFQGELSEGIFREMIVSDNVKETVDRYVMNCSLPTAERIDL